MHVKHLSPKQAKARALSLGDVACCSASALGRSLRLAGWPVGADDVLALHWLTAGSPDAGASIWATLDAALRHGLAGVRPVGFEPMDLEGMAGQDSNLHPPISGGYALGPSRLPHGALSAGPPAIPVASVVLGLDMPEGPHAVTLDPTGAVWSWGGLHDLWPDVVVEEAWRVVWPSWL